MWRMGHESWILIVVDHDTLATSTGCFPCHAHIRAQVRGFVRGGPVRGGWAAVSRLIEISDRRDAVDAGREHGT